MLVVPAYLRFTKQHGHGGKSPRTAILELAQGDPGDGSPFWCEFGRRKTGLEQGVGKTWVVCALARQATRCGMRVAYRRLPRLLEDMEVARETGTLPNARAQLGKMELLVVR